jgi:hypothetical protein
MPEYSLGRLSDLKSRAQRTGGPINPGALSPQCL